MHALIVDDSMAARQMAQAAVEDALLDLGHEPTIDVADGGVEALKLLAAGDVDLLVVDLHMPDIHGIEVLSFWRKRGGSGPALVVSTGVSDIDQERALKAGATAFVEKPIQADAIIDILRTALEEQG